MLWPFDIHKHKCLLWDSVTLHRTTIPNPRRHMPDNIRFSRCWTQSNRASHSGCHMTHKTINAYVNQTFRTIHKMNYTKALTHIQRTDSFTLCTELFTHWQKRWLSIRCMIWWHEWQVCVCECDWHNTGCHDDKASVKHEIHVILDYLYAYLMNVLRILNYKCDNSCGPCKQFCNMFGLDWFCISEFFLFQSTMCNDK